MKLRTDIKHGDRGEENIISVDMGGSTCFHYYNQPGVVTKSGTSFFRDVELAAAYQVHPPPPHAVCSEKKLVKNT